MKTVRAKMRVNEVKLCGADAKKPQIAIQCGAVYSQDPHSENKSFAIYTPSASLTLNIDAGAPAAAVFKESHGKEIYVDVTVLEVPARTYLKDAVPAGEAKQVVMVETVDGTTCRAEFNRDHNAKPWTTFELGGLVHRTQSEMLDAGWEYWRYPNEGEALA